MAVEGLPALILRIPQIDQQSLPALAVQSAAKPAAWPAPQRNTKKTIKILEGEVLRQQKFITRYWKASFRERMRFYTNKQKLIVCLLFLISEIYRIVCVR